MMPPVTAWSRPSDAQIRSAPKRKSGQLGFCQFQRMIDRVPFYQSSQSAILIESATVNQWPKAHCRCATSICGDGRSPFGEPFGHHDCRSAVISQERSAIRSARHTPLKHDPALRAEGLVGPC
jgi:hypothetical protein